MSSEYAHSVGITGTERKLKRNFMLATVQALLTKLLEFTPKERQMIRRNCAWVPSEWIIFRYNGQPVRPGDTILRGPFRVRPFDQKVPLRLRGSHERSMGSIMLKLKE